MLKNVSCLKPLSSPFCNSFISMFTLHTKFHIAIESALNWVKSEKFCNHLQWKSPKWAFIVTISCFFPFWCVSKQCNRKCKWWKSSINNLIIKYNSLKKQKLSRQIPRLFTFTIHSSTSSIRSDGANKSFSHKTSLPEKCFSHVLPQSLCRLESRSHKTVRNQHPFILLAYSFQFLHLVLWVNEDAYKIGCCLYTTSFMLHVLSLELFFFLNFYNFLPFFHYLTMWGYSCVYIKWTQVLYSKWMTRKMSFTW